MSSCHEARRHPAFPLSHTAVAEEVVAVHHSQLIQEELYGALAPSLLWTLTLERTHTTWEVNDSAVTFRWGWRRLYTSLPAPVSVWWAAHGCDAPGSPVGRRRRTRSSRSGWSFHCSSLSSVTASCEHWGFLKPRHVTSYIDIISLDNPISVRLCLSCKI